MTTNKKLDRLIEDFAGYCVVEPLKEYKKMRQLIRRVAIYCSSPGGRFGEDECRKCAACKLNKLLLGKE